MAQLYAGKPSSFYSTTGGKPVEGAWYSGQRYLGGKLLAPGEYEPGKMTSDSVIAQTNPNNVDFIRQQRELNANEITAPLGINLSSGSDTNGLNAQVESYRAKLESEYARRREDIALRTESARAMETKALEGIDQQTQPFMAEMSANLRDQYGVEGDVQARLDLGRQTLDIYNEVQALIREQEGVSGLAAVRNPRIQKTIDEGMARIASHQAAIAALDGNVALANNEIDRAISFVQADRQNRINYYNTLLDISNRDILNLDAESKELAQKEVALLENDLARAQQSADYIKDLMINPDTALAMAQSGVTFNDSIETINQKLSTFQYSQEVREQNNKMTMAGARLVTDPFSVPQNQLTSFTDSQGRTHYYRLPANAGSGSGFDIATFDQSLIEEGVTQPGLAGLILDVAKNQAINQHPKFIPTSGIGTQYTDPETGLTWEFTNDGWYLVG